MTAALVVPVAEAEPLVAAWRERFDPPAIRGMPAHVTVLYPFVPAGGLTDEVVSQLAMLCADVPILDVAFRRAARFPDALYLEPEPAEDFRRLTRRVAAAWPESPPYGGAFDDVVPHLTVAVGVDEPTFAQVDASLRQTLPIRARLSEARLYALVGERWQERARLPFG